MSPRGDAPCVVVVDDHEDTCLMYAQQFAHVHPEPADALVALLVTLLAALVSGVVALRFEARGSAPRVTPVAVALTPPA